VLSLIARSEDGLSLREVAGALGLKAPTAHNLLRTLAAKGFLERTGRPVRYRLGGAVMELADLRARRDWLRGAAEVVADLHRAFPAGTVTFAEPVGGEVMATLRMSWERPGVLERPTNRVMSAYGTASAIVYQAFASEEERSAYRRRHPFWEEGAMLWHDPPRLEAFLAEVRRTGRAVLDLKSSVMWPVAAAVFGPYHEFRAILGVSYPVTGLDESTRRRIIDRVLDAARRISVHTDQDTSGKGQESC